MSSVFPEETLRAGTGLSGHHCGGRSPLPSSAGSAHSGTVRARRPRRQAGKACRAADRRAFCFKEVTKSKIGLGGRNPLLLLPGQKGALMLFFR